jgi:hypothetical protein
MAASRQNVADKVDARHRPWPMVHWDNHTIQFWAVLGNILCNL